MNTEHLIVMTTLARHMEPKQLTAAAAELRNRVKGESSEDQFFRRMADTLQIYATDLIREKADEMEAAGWKRASIRTPDVPKEGS